MLATNLTEKKMEELDEADEALIKSITFHGSKDFVQRIEDDDDIEELSQSSSSLSGNLKRKFAAEPSVKVEEATDYLTKTTGTDYAKDGGKLSASMKPKFIGKPRSVLQISKKPHITNEDSDPSNDKGDGKKHDIKGAQSINGLQSLFQNYDSDDSD